MIIRLLLLFLLWLILRRVWRLYTQGRSSAGATRRDPYPGPRKESPDARPDITQQKITDAEFEELDDRDS